jgi:hypothetical protein
MFTVHTKDISSPGRVFSWIIFGAKRRQRGDEEKTLWGEDIATQL